MTSTKFNRAYAEYVRLGGFGGHETTKAVFAQIGDDTTKSLSGKQIGAMAALLYKAYNKGKRSSDAEIDGDAIWIGAGVNKFIALEALKALTIDYKVVLGDAKEAAKHWDPLFRTPRSTSYYHYSLDYTEAL